MGADEYMPTTEAVRGIYAGEGVNLPPIMAAAFDRWLAEHDREVAAKTLTEFADAHRMPLIVFMRSDGSSVTVGDLMRETAAAIREGHS